MQDQLNALLEQAKIAILAANSLKGLDDCRVHYLGKNGQFTELLKSVSQAPKSDRPVLGKIVNEAKIQLQQWMAEAQVQLQEAAFTSQLAAEKIDVTLPGRNPQLGSLHPVTLVRQRVVQLFTQMGFTVETGPEIEDEEHNFDALNIPASHPARAMADTFYFSNGQLLRTQTSPVQIRVMRTQQPPIRIITPGRVYRRDSDQTHTPMFHQMECLVIDKTCTFADLKGLLQHFLESFFEKELTLRFRPSFFPFTEPSAEVDIAYEKADGTQAFLEVLGCGMVHPQVLKNVEIDPDQYRGFAFGIGLDRLAMLRYGIHDLRTLFENDLRFLEQF